MANIVFLKTFVSLAKTKSFRTAAQLNFITQSAVSQQIRTLESKCECRLFERNNKIVELTQEGKVFFDYAQKIIEQYEEALQEVSVKSASYSGIIKIATIYSIGLYRLQSLIRTFLKKFPQINVYLEYYHNDLIYEKLLNQTIDFGFVAFPKKRQNITSFAFVNEEMILVQSSQRPLLKKRNINYSDLNHCQFVSLSHTTPTGKEIAKFLKGLSLDINVIHEFENVETLKSAVVIGMGCAFIPRFTVMQELKNKMLEEIHVQDFNFHRPIAIIKSNQKVLNKSKQKFYEMIVSC